MAMSEQDVSRFGPGPGRRRPDTPAAPLGKLFDREPPYSREAEASLLGSMILDPNQIGDVMMVVRRPDDFYLVEHQHIYKAIIEVYDAHHSGDLVQIQEKLRSAGVYDLVGGGEKLVELAEAVPSAVNAPHYARIVAEKSKLRRLIDAAGRILYDAYHVGNLGPEGVKEVVDAAETAVFEIAEDETANEPEDLQTLLHKEMERLEAQDGQGYSGVPTGYGDLDELLRGLQPGELIIVAARPSMGKTALALNMAEQIALGGGASGKAEARCPIAVFSLEMSKGAVTQRLISARSGLSSHHLRSGHGVDFRKVIQACGELAQAPVFVDDTPNMSVMTLRARARRLYRQHKIRCIMIDYLQLLTAPSAARESRQVEVSSISRGIKALARELNVPIVCLSQLNRASEQREGNRPRMADLRESGSIEQDADVIVLLHREEYYHVQNPDWALENPDKVGIAELIVAKQRNGPTGVVKLKWDSGSTRFKNLDEYAREPVDIDRYNRPAAGAEPAPFAPQVFVPGRKTGPVAGHRDGGGPDRSGDAGIDDLPV
ncbi:MAG: replicative DNA helicase [Phycisphaeraceae bacterium]|nr:MAG: replicative DNA helicase [Phycisphaeraceae bacterium]